MSASQSQSITRGAPSKKNGGGRGRQGQNNPQSGSGARLGAAQAQGRRGPKPLGAMT
jgi:hypothetical protein